MSMYREMKTSDWTQLLREADSLRGQGRIEPAIQLCEHCAARFKSEPDARGWALYNLFRLLSEAGRLEDAAALGPEILKLGSNFASKLFVAISTLHTLRDARNHSQVSSFVRNIDDWIGAWMETEPSADDIAVPMGMTLVNLVNSTGVGTNHIKMIHIDDNSEVVAQLPIQEYQRTAPIFYNALPIQLREYQNSCAGYTALTLYRAKMVTLRRIGLNVFAFNIDGALLPIHYGSFPSFFVPALEALAKKTPLAKRITEPAVSMLDEFNNDSNFCHWMVDQFPRVLYAESLGVPFAHVIGPTSLTSDYQVRCVTSLKRNYLTVDSDTPMFFTELIYANNYGSNLHHPMFNCNPVLRSLVHGLFEGDILAGRNEHNRIYVPRTHTRRVRNESELVKVLNTLQFTTIDTDNVSLSTQIKMFASATHIVAPHGAALTGLLFARRGAHVLEFFPRPGASAAFYALATSANLNYSCYHDALGMNSKGTTPPVLVNDADINVDVDFVERWFFRTQA